VENTDAEAERDWKSGGTESHHDVIGRRQRRKVDFSKIKTSGRYSEGGGSWARRIASNERETCEMKRADEAQK